MNKIINFISKLSKVQKITYLCSLVVLVLLLSIGIPTLARFKNRNTIYSTTVWDGSVATSYRSGSGTSNDPYVIVNGSQLAYLEDKLNTTNYEGVYFTLGNDILINNGTFNYDGTNLLYILNGVTYYLDLSTNKYYDNSSLTGTEIGTVNTFNSMDNFKGTLDGNSFKIYGLYITSLTNKEVALFTNLEGTIKDLYVENSVINGGSITGGIASTTNNSNIINTLFNGVVLGSNSNVNQSTSLDISSYNTTLSNSTKIDSISLTNNFPFAGSIIESTSISGTYTINGDSNTVIKINDVEVSNGTFNIDLGTNIINSVGISITTDSLSNVDVELSNIKYNVTYKYGVAGGLVGVSKNTNFVNSINKAYVKSYSISGGLIGTINDLTTINQSYNVGSINSNYMAGGLVGKIESTDDLINITNSYNSGEVTSLNKGGLIGVISFNTGSINLNNLFDTSSTYSIGNVNSTVVNVNNSYNTSNSSINNGTLVGSFTNTTIDNLKTKSYMINNLLYKEFISFDDIATNTNNAFVYSGSSLPILFIDDINDSIANINVNVYSWNNLSSNLNTIKLNSNITFSIEGTNELRPIKNIYYYISNSSTVLSIEELQQLSSFELYENIETINTEGNYIIYAKIIDYNDNVTYINTDLLVLDFLGVSADVIVGSSKWTKLHSELDYLYTDGSYNLEVNVTDKFESNYNIKYYISSSILDVNSLNLLTEDKWLTYTSVTNITNRGTNIIYVRIIDSYDYKTYINTDYIVNDGYTMNDLIIGRDINSYTNTSNNITNKSSITLNYSYTNTEEEKTNLKHSLVTNYLLPKGSKITLLDNTTNKVYQYTVDTEGDYKYLFTLFKEIGSSIDKNYIEKNYYSNGAVTENFTIVIDFSNTNITSNIIGMKVFLNVTDDSDKVIRPTLASSVKPYNIYVDKNANLNLSTDTTISSILYNSDSTTSVNINSYFNYNTINNSIIYDTRYENKRVGLEIKLVDSNSNVVSNKYLKNMMFKIGDTVYYPNSNNIIYIDLNSNIGDVTKTLTIITSTNNSILNNGTYSIVISNYISNDGISVLEYGANTINIPLVISNTNTNINYSFNVLTDDKNRIISKSLDTVNVIYNITQTGSFTNPNVKVSLYKKSSLTAYNQDYELVDLNNYISLDLLLYKDNIYYVSTSLSNSFDLELNFITKNFVNTGYKLVFDLYDGSKKIGTIEKNFIVR